MSSSSSPRTFDYDFPAYSHPRPASPPSSHIRPSYLHPQTTKQHNQTRARGPSSASTSSEASTSTSTSSADPSSSSSPSASTSSPRTSTPPRRRHALPRPSWERDFAQSQDDLDDIDREIDADSDYSPEPRHKPSFSPHLYGATTPYPYYDSPPRSYEDDASSSPLRSRLSHDSKHSHQEVDAHRAIALGLSLGLRRKRWEWDEKAGYGYAGDQEKRGVLVEEEEPTREAEGDVVDDEDVLDDDEGDDEEQYIRSSGHADFTPTCSEALKRKWQAVSLSWRFGVFRAKRRIRTRVGL